MQFAQERVTPRLCEELAPLFAQNRAEISWFKEAKLEPDFERYDAADKDGTLCLFTMRTEAGALAGYSIFWLATHTHFRNALVALQDTLFVAAEHRRGTDGTQFISWCDEQLRSRAAYVLRQVTANIDYSPILKRLGYEAIEQTFGRKL